LSVDFDHRLCEKRIMVFPNRYFDIPYIPETEVIDLPALLDAGDAPIELEIGFGRGHFLIERGRAVPNHRIIGLEIKRKGVFIAVERSVTHGLANLHPFHGDVFKALPRFCPEASVDRIFIHFPDPWWKTKHEKRMVICPDLIHHAARLLKDEGELFVQTDVDYRFEQYRAVLCECPDLVPREGTGRIDHNPYEARSLREKKCIASSLPILRLLFERRHRSEKPEVSL
jgi:tRNA (guanine-N7-)-methyltransferase